VGQAISRRCAVLPYRFPARRILAAHERERVNYYVERRGHYGATEGRNQAWALISVQLKPMGQRPTRTNTYELVEQLQQWAETKPGFRSLEVQAQNDIPVTGKPVEIEIISTGDERYTVADDLLSYLKQHPAIQRSWSSYTPGKDVIELDINFPLLAARGLTVQQLIQALSVAVVLCYSTQGLSMGMMAMTGVIGIVGVLVSLVLLPILYMLEQDSLVGFHGSLCDVSSAKRMVL
jgi:multidrug efflux pump subunit AcrB